MRRGTRALHLVSCQDAGSEELGQAGQCRKKRVATVALGPHGTPHVRLRSKRSLDSLQESNTTPKRKVTFTPTPPTKKSKTDSESPQSGNTSEPSSLLGRIVSRAVCSLGCEGLSHLLVMDLALSSRLANALKPAPMKPCQTGGIVVIDGSEYKAPWRHRYI